MGCSERRASVPDWGMLTASAALLAAALLAVPGATPAQTLDELNHPLLSKGAASVDVAAQAYGIRHESVDVFSGRTSHLQPELVFFPRVSVGLGSGLQIDVSATDQFAWPHLRPDDWGSRRESNVVHAFEAGILFRPSQRVQVAADVIWGRADSNTDHESGGSLDATRQADRSAVVSIDAVWLPGGERETRPLRADLDGLHRPLLDPGRWRFDAEVQWRSYSLVQHDTHEPFSGTFDFSTRSRDLLLQLGAARGVAGHGELRGEAYWEPPFTMEHRWQALDPWGGSTGRYASASRERYQGVFGARMATTWRAGLVEADASISWERLVVTYSEGPTYTADDTCRTASVAGDLTWLSRAPRTTVAREGLPGFDRPLIERAQVLARVSVGYQGFREDSPTFDRDAWTGEVGVTTGLASWADVTGRVGVMLSKHYLSGDDYWGYVTSGLTLTVRPRQRFQVCASFDENPQPDLARFPTSILGANDPFSYYWTFTGAAFSGNRNARVGVRVIW